MSEHEMRKEALRDQFAARAMQGWVTAIACNQEAENLLKRGGVEPGNVEAFVARCCYDIADAMMMERAKRMREER